MPSSPTHWPESERAPIVATLPNGVRTVAVSRPFGDVATVVAAVPAGELYESGADGVASVLARVMTYGTRTYQSPAALAESIEGIGGAFGVSAGDDHATVSATVPVDRLEEAARIVVEIATEPLLPEHAVLRERQVIAGRLRAAAAEPSARAGELLGMLLFPNSPMGRTYLAQAEAVEKIGQADAVDFHRRQYGAGSAVFGASAPVLAGEIAAVLQREAAHWFAGTPTQAAEAGDQGGRFAYVPVESELAYLALGARAVPFDHPDRYGLNLLAVTLGGGMTSRLFVEVREKRGLCYGIGARLSVHRTTGAFTISAGVPPDRFTEAIAAILEQIGLSTRELSDTELARAKALLRGRLAMESDDGDQITSRYVTDVLHYNRPRLASEILQMIDPLTTADLGRLAVHYLAPANLHLGVAGTFPGAPPDEGVLLNGTALSS
jgi:predicted Zn-dependent peptidase